MHRANLVAVADTSDPALERLHVLAAARARAEKAYRKAYAAERAEIVRLLQAKEAGSVAIAEVIGRTREAVRQTFNQWKKERAEGGEPPAAAG